MKATKGRQAGKSIEEVVAFAISHRIRVQVLALLNEGVYTPQQIADVIGEPLNKVAHHIHELAEAGSIELADTKMVRNAVQHYYRGVQMPFYTDEDVAQMTPQQRQVTAGLIIQSIQAELMAALWAGKMHSDPRVWLAWRWFNVDKQGRNDIADEQQRHWDRIQQIEAESTNRRAESGEDAKSIIVATLGFGRERTAPGLPGENAE